MAKKTTETELAKKSTGTAIAKKPPDGEVIGFNYDVIEDTSVVKQLQDTVELIRPWIQSTLENHVKIGQELLKVKDSLKHGQWGAWLASELDMSVRSAQVCMNLAERSKSAIIAHSSISYTAAQVLLSPSVPDAAWNAAVKRSENGEKISVDVAHEIRDKVMKKASPKKLSTQQLGLRLGTLLERQKGLWKPGDYPKLARLLREFADELVGRKSGAKKKAKK